MDDRSFLRCTPRKLLSQWEVHKKYHGIKPEDENEQEEGVYITDTII